MVGGGGQIHLFAGFIFENKGENTWADPLYILGLMMYNRVKQSVWVLYAKWICIDQLWKFSIGEVNGTTDKRTEEKAYLDFVAYSLCYDSSLYVYGVLRNAEQ